jgi:hypothetical protein
VSFVWWTFFRSRKRSFLIMQQIIKR